MPTEYRWLSVGNVIVSSKHTTRIVRRAHGGVATRQKRKRG